MTDMRQEHEALIKFWSDIHTDLESVRIQIGNRVNSLTHPHVEGDRGGKFGYGLASDRIEVQKMQATFDILADAEHQAELELRRALRQNPLGPWVKRTVGIGEKQAARFLGAAGDLASRSKFASLNAYCGLGLIEVSSGSDTNHHGCASTGNSTSVRVAPRRQRGIKDNWNGVARSRAILMAMSCIKQAHSPYRLIYERARAKNADRVHEWPCTQCTPRGKPPAPIGSPLRASHQHARALREVARHIVKDMWKESRRLAMLDD